MSMDFVAGQTCMCLKDERFCNMFCATDEMYRLEPASLTGECGTFLDA